MIGHGAPGFRSKLRTLLDLIDTGGTAGVTMLEVQAGKLMASGSWTVHSGSVYKQAAAFTFDGVVAHVVGVECSIAPKVLTRVEAIADVVAGTFFFDADAAAPELYLHLPDSSNPSGAVVVALLLFCFATKGIVHPHLGPNRLTDPGMEAWTTGENLTSWTEDVTGSGWGVRQDAAIAPSGSYSAKLQAIGVTSGMQRIGQTMSGNFVVGAWYRAAGYYRTSEAFTNIEARIKVGTGSSDYLATDGRNVNDSDPPILLPTQGEVRRFGFDLLANNSSLRMRTELHWLSGTGDGSLWVDGLSFQRIYRFHYYEPRLAVDSIPQVEAATARLFFGGKTVGVGEAKIINQDGLYEAILGQLVLDGKSAQVCVGGEFPDGQTIGREDCRISYPGEIQDVDVSDARITLRLEAQTFMRIVLPLKLYKLADFSNLELNREGYARPLLFGNGEWDGQAIRFVRPTRTGRDATTQYGENYEIVDPTDSPAGISDITVLTFRTEEERGLAS
jgi:hypothetical protein